MPSSIVSKHDGSAGLVYLTPGNYERCQGAKFGIPERSVESMYHVVGAEPRLDNALVALKSDIV
jgi:hypothetical protein